MRQSKHLMFAGLAVGVALGLGTSISAADASRRNGESGLGAVTAVIDALDRCVQERFARIDNGFGRIRVSISMHNIHLFIPVNDSERKVVRELDTMRARVVMYLAGWQRPRRDPRGASAIPLLIQGPIVVNPTPEVVRTTPEGAPFEVHAAPRLLQGLPNETDVRAEAAASLTAFADSDSREFDVGRWRFVARPVRASAEACLSCHNARSSIGTTPETLEPVVNVFRLGDPLGAVLYGYQTPLQHR